MTKTKIYSIFLFLFTIGATANAQNEKTEIMFVGFDHLSQMDNGTPESDVFSYKKQQEILQLTNHLQKFSPDMVMVEVEPKRQSSLDSLFTLYKNDDLNLSDIENGSSETYQVGFRLGKLNDLTRIYGVDHYEATSQSLLNNGSNISLFQKELKNLQNTARPLKQSVQKDSLSIYDYIVFMNKPETIHLTHNLFYNLPAYVVDGKFSDSGTNTVDLGEVDEKYIGAEYITLFYNRNLKIYSNILNAQLKNHGKRLIVLLGQVHVGVLKELFEKNPNYKVVSPIEYLN